jgi:two-component system chemotaxis response regulator CheB
MGQDGRKGAEAILAAGGQVLIQDEATAAGWGVPECGVVARLGDPAGPVAAIAYEIGRRTAKRAVTAAGAR